MHIYNSGLQVSPYHMTVIDYSMLKTLTLRLFVMVAGAKIEEFILCYLNIKNYKYSRDLHKPSIERTIDENVAFRKAERDPGSISPPNFAFK